MQRQRPARCSRRRGLKPWQPIRHHPRRSQPVSRNGFHRQRTRRSGSARRPAPPDESRAHIATRRSLPPQSRLERRPWHPPLGPAATTSAFDSPPQTAVLPARTIEITMRIRVHVCHRPSAARAASNSLVSGKGQPCSGAVKKSRSVQPVAATCLSGVIRPKEQRRTESRAPRTHRTSSSSR